MLLDLESFAVRDTLVGSPGPVDTSVKLGVQTRCATVRSSSVDDRLDLLSPVAGGDQDGVGGFDDDEIANADRR